MELLPIIYTSLLIFAALAFIVVIFSYVSFKIRKSVKEEEKKEATEKKEVPHQVKVLIKKSKERAAEIEKRKGSSSKSSSSKSRSSRKPSSRQTRLSSSHYQKKKSHRDHHGKVKRLEILNPSVESSTYKDEEKKKEKTKNESRLQNLNGDIISKYDDNPDTDFHRLDKDEK